ncbi:MAG: FAD-dependent oxidoreductase, partial [Burkholderiales bacterium]|nr:FAD-dependent oxidoreductase [Anaerolineae bacterium]
LQSLRDELDQPDLTPVDTCAVNWVEDPFALGGYSSTNPGGIAARETLAQPTLDESGTPRLYWAGEATAPLAWIATVHGAHISGQRVANEVLSTE